MGRPPSVSVEDITKIKQLHGQGLTVREIERVFSRAISRSTISRVLRGLTNARPAITPKYANKVDADFADL